MQVDVIGCIQFPSLLDSIDLLDIACTLYTYLSVYIMCTYRFYLIKFYYYFKKIINNNMSIFKYQMVKLTSK